MRVADASPAGGSEIQSSPQSAKTRQSQLALSWFSLRETFVGSVIHTLKNSAASQISVVKTLILEMILNTESSTFSKSYSASHWSDFLSDA